MALSGLFRRPNDPTLMALRIGRWSKSVTTASIKSDDLTVADLFKSFYRVPDYQREYVWGESDASREGGDEVEKFLRDIHSEFELATAQSAPEYFIGTIVVCPGSDGVFELIDGQQRTTTAFLTLCAMRDTIITFKAEPPADLTSQIAAGSTDWQGETVHRIRLDLQYEDSGDILQRIGEGELPDHDRAETRSIRNIVGAYRTISEFLRTFFNEDVTALRRFYGYFTNKVKLIRIETPSVSKALKIFETINDRGVGLDAMDLLKNLLFMNANEQEFQKLKAIWKEISQNIYEAGEKPLRFLRYFIIANYIVDPRIREEEIYSWFTNNNSQVAYISAPLKFAEKLRNSARAYKQFALGNNSKGEFQQGLWNTRALGGRAFKQHFVLLLSGINLPDRTFNELSRDLEELLFVWLISGVAAKEYDRLIANAAKQLREVRDQKGYELFKREFISAEKKRNAQNFEEAIQEMVSWDLRQFRLKYFLGKIAQYIDIDAYGSDGHDDLRPYLDSLNDIEHILSRNATRAAKDEFGERADDEDYIESLGNLMWLERSINRSIQNVSYSEKIKAYPSSAFLWARCQGAPLPVGKNDKITKALAKVPSYKKWNYKNVENRQEWMATTALKIWKVK